MTISSLASPSVVLVLVAIASCACQSRQTPTPSPKAQDAQQARFQANRYSTFSREAQSLRYPPGTDTVAYWGDGRFQVVLNNLFDNQNNQNGAIVRGVRAFVQRDSLVFFAAAGEYLILDLENNTWIAHSAIGEFHGAEQPVLHELETQLGGNPSGANDIVVFDPKTLLPK